MPEVAWNSLKGCWGTVVQSGSWEMKMSPDGCLQGCQDWMNQRTKLLWTWLNCELPEPARHFT